MRFGCRKAACAKGFARLTAFLCIASLPLAGSYAAKKAAEPKGTSIPLPATVKTRNFASFSDVKPRILELLEDGSPRSIEIASRLLHRSNPSSYSDNEKVLLQVCSLLTEFCWPSSRVSWDAPEIKTSNYYTNVLLSVRNGIYDEPLRSEFIATLLPCVCLFSAPKETAFYGSAEAALEKLLARKSNSTIANYLMGVLLNRQGRNGKALDYLRRAAAADASNRDILGLQMRVCTALARFDDALAIGEKLLAADPQNMTALELCCDAYYFKGDMAKAGDLAARILMLDSRNYKYVLIRAESSMDGGDYVKASTLLDAYSRGGAGNREKQYFLLRARLQSEWNKSDASAAETLGQALLAYPDDSEIQLAAAKVASNGNMKLAGKTALEFARLVLRKDAANREAVQVCIAELAREGSYEEAYQLSSSFVKQGLLKTLPAGGPTGVPAAASKAGLSGGLSAGDAGLLHTHIDICVALGKFDEATSLATRLYNTDRTDTEARKSYIKVLVATGRKADAQDMIASLMADADASLKSFLYYEQSFLYTDDKSVVAQLRSSLTQNPRNTDALTRLYEVYYNKQDWKKAQYYLKQVVALNPTNKKALAMSKKLDKIINN